MTAVMVLVLSSCGLIQQSTQRPSISAEDTRLIINALIEDIGNINENLSDLTKNQNEARTDMLKIVTRKEK